MGGPVSAGDAIVLVAGMALQGWLAVLNYRHWVRRLRAWQEKRNRRDA
jgi:hypothetical protein